MDSRPPRGTLTFRRPPPRFRLRLPPMLDPLDRAPKAPPRFGGPHRGPSSQSLHLVLLGAKPRHRWQLDRCPLPDGGDPRRLPRDPGPSALRCDAAVRPPDPDRLALRLRLRLPMKAFYVRAAKGLIAPPRPPPAPRPAPAPAGAPTSYFAVFGSRPRTSKRDRACGVRPWG